MKPLVRAFRLEIVWTLLLIALTLAVPSRLYGGDDGDDKCLDTDLGDCPAPGCADCPDDL